MSIDGYKLPDDPETLKAMVRHLYDHLRKAERRLDKLEAELSRPRPPQRSGDTDQLYLFDSVDQEQVELDAAESKDGDSEDDDDGDDDRESDHAEDEGNGKKPAKPRRRRGRRKPLPEDLLRIVKRHEIAAGDPRRSCPCCETTMPEVAVRKTEQLDFLPASFVVIEHQQPTYACRKCEVGAIRQSKPAQPIERGLPGPGLLAQVIVNRFDDHLPYHRQAQMFNRQGVTVSARSMSRWMASSAELLSPIVGHMLEEVLRSRRIHTDDTTFPVLDPGRGKTQAAKIWCYVGDRSRPHTVYEVTERRTRDAPERVLAGFAGTLQADAFSGYDCIYASGDVQEAACWSHARRKFEPCSELGAREMITLIAEMYKVERRGRRFKLSEENRRRLRERRVVPILERIRDCRDRLAATVRPKSNLAMALTYISRQWDALTFFASTGHIEPDNNIAERSLRSVAIGRRNWMFAGSLEAAQNAATLISLIESCERNEVNTFEYLRDVLQRISVHPSSRISELTPAGWKAARAAEDDAA
jgi:transposase